MEQLTIKDIERMRDRVRGDLNLYDLYLEVDAPEGETLLYFKSFDNLKKYVKENYNEDLTHKENSKKKIVGVKIWRN
jgi:hypothetical protein